MPPLDTAALRPRLERAFDFATQQVKRTIETYPDFFPIYTVDGSGGTRANSGPIGAADSSPG